MSHRRGTTRWYDDGVGDSIEERVARLANSVAAGFGCTARVDYQRRYPATINDPASAKLVRDVAGAAPERHRLSAEHGRRGFRLHAAGGSGVLPLARRGTRGENPGLHSPRYDFNDDVLPAGVALWVSLVRRSLARP